MALCCFLTCSTSSDSFSMQPRISSTWTQTDSHEDSSHSAVRLHPPNPSSGLPPPSPPPLPHSLTCSKNSSMKWSRSTCTTSSSSSLSLACKQEVTHYNSVDPPHTHTHTSPNPRPHTPPYVPNNLLDHIGQPAHRISSGQSGGHQ